MKKTTLGIIKEDGKIMLAMKKRGFGAGFYNGVGGKLEKGETIEQGMIREANEEIGINVKKLEKIGTLHFYFDDNKDWNQSVYVFFINNYTGNIEESEEMKPFWFDLDKIPYDKMWEDDKIWLPGVLSGEKNIEYKFVFEKDGKLKNFERLS